MVLVDDWRARVFIRVRPIFHLILEGNASKTATIMEWRGQQHAVNAVRRGNDVIISTRHYCYLDYCQTSDPENEPLCVSRLAALSETAWAYDRKDSYEDFSDRAKALLPGLYESYGYNYAPYFFNDIE